MSKGKGIDVDTTNDGVDPQTGGIVDIAELNRAFGLADNIAPDSVEDLEAYFEDQGGIIEFEGSPWELVKKEELVGKAFYIANTRFYEGKFGSACAVMAILEADGRRVVFNDGSTGVLQQLLGVVAKTKRKGGFHCPRGLRKSEFTWQEKDFTGNPIGEPKPATTYYVA